MLPEYVWDAAVLEGSPITFPEVKTLIEGVTVGGRKASDQEQILNLARGFRYLLDLVKRREFELDKRTFCSLQESLTRNDTFESGSFRDEMFANGISALDQNVPNAFERAAALFLFGSLQKFFFAGNERTSRLMMSGILMMAGIDAISIPAVRATHFSSRMADFYRSRDATEIMAFALDCHPEIAQIRRLNPGIVEIKDLPGIEYYRFEDGLLTPEPAPTPPSRPPRC